MSSVNVKEGCVVSVRARDALAWAGGTLDDLDLLRDSPLVPEAVFIINLPDLSSYRCLLERVKRLRDEGCVFLITRTGTPEVERHLVKNGCLWTFKENTTPPKSRYIALPGPFAAWVEKWSSEDRCARCAMLGPKAPPIL
jgi:hypothetical protein